MTALKMLAAGLTTASALLLAGAPPALAEPSTPSQTQYLSNGPEEDCPGDGCQAPRPPKSIYPRHVYACVRGACVPLPAPKSWR